MNQRSRRFAQEHLGWENKFRWTTRKTEQQLSNKRGKTPYWSSKTVTMKWYYSVKMHPSHWSITEDITAPSTSWTLAISCLTVYQIFLQLEMRSIAANFTQQTCLESQIQIRLQYFRSQRQVERSTMKASNINRKKLNNNSRRKMAVFSFRLSRIRSLAEPN